MSPEKILDTLAKWRELVDAFSKIVVDFREEQQVIDARLKDRQQIIDSLQVLDADLVVIRGLKAQGWPSISAEKVKMIETIIEKGNVISKGCVANDEKSLVVAKESRQEVSGHIGNVRKSKGYLTSSHVVKNSPSIIVDSHA